MMNRTKTRKIHLLKFICIVPLGCLLLFAFSGGPGKPPVGNHTKDAFSLSRLSFYINDENVARLVQKEQSNSLLKEGGALSLALISEEKARLNDILEKNGYDTSGGRIIRFVMDTSATTQSFSVKVVIELQKSQLEKSPANSTFTDETITAKNSKIDVYMGENRSKNFVKESPPQKLYRVNSKGFDQVVLHPASGK